MNELLKLYEQCFPEKNAEAEIKALGSNFKFELEADKAFIIYTILAETEAEIIDVGTSPDFRKKGLAEKLLKKLLTELKQHNIKDVFLEVAENNIPALNLYKKCDFEEYNRRKAYYSGKNQPGDIVKNTRIDAILMRKSL